MVVDFSYSIWKLYIYYINNINVVCWILCCLKGEETEKRIYGLLITIIAIAICQTSILANEIQNNNSQKENLNSHLRYFKGFNNCYILL